MEDVFFTQWNKGVEEFVVQASRLYNGERNQTIRMDDVKAIISRRDDQQTRITGDNAFYNTGQKILTLADNVRLLTDDGYDLQTSVLRYLTDARQVETSAQVRLAGKNMRISGTGLRYDLTSGDFKVGGRVMIEIN